MNSNSTPFSNPAPTVDATEIPGISVLDPILTHRRQHSLLTDALEEWIKSAILDSRSRPSTPTDPSDEELLIHQRRLAYLSASRPLKALDTLSPTLLQAVRKLFTTAMEDGFDFVAAPDDLADVYVELCELNASDMPWRATVEECLAYLYCTGWALDTEERQALTGIFVEMGYFALRERWSKGLLRPGQVRLVEAALRVCLCDLKEALGWPDEGREEMLMVVLRTSRILLEFFAGEDFRSERLEILMLKYLDEKEVNMKVAKAVKDLTVESAKEWLSDSYE